MVKKILDARTRYAPLGYTKIRMSLLDRGVIRIFRHLGGGDKNARAYGGPQTILGSFKLFNIHG
jgi:hypothetical protein